jgi:hypothetical protein
MAHQALMARCRSFWLSKIHFTSPHADTSRFMQNMSITEGSGWASDPTFAVIQ